MGRQRTERLRHLGACQLPSPDAHEQDATPERHGSQVPADRDPTAARVVVDIGMHLELEIPAHERYHPGERWTPELALPFVIERSMFPEDFMRSEVDRYLGWPGQAISYKVGERVWLECRAEAQARKGPDFDLKAFHTYALDLGGMGLATLREELARF